MTRCLRHVAINSECVLQYQSSIQKAISKQAIEIYWEEHALVDGPIRSLWPLFLATS